MEPSPLCQPSFFFFLQEQKKHFAAALVVMTLTVKNIFYAFMFSLHLSLDHSQLWEDPTFHWDLGAMFVFFFF